MTTSLPAACLAQHLLAEEWRLTLDQGGGLVALQVGRGMVAVGEQLGRWHLWQLSLGLVCVMLLPHTYMQLRESIIAHTFW